MRQVNFEFHKTVKLMKELTPWNYQLLALSRKYLICRYRQFAVNRYNSNVTFSM